MANAEQQRHEQEVRTYLIRQQQSLQRRWNDLSELIARLRRAYAIETDEAIRFKLEKQLEDLEVERARIERKLQEIETDLADLPACTSTRSHCRSRTLPCASGSWNNAPI